MIQRLQSSLNFFALIALMILILQVPAKSQSPFSPSLVNLGTSGDFVVIAKTGISSTGTTAITGDLGISPADATYITGFGLIMDVTNTFSISSVVTGKIFAADYTTPTPSKMTTAIGDMEIAYTDAAGRTLPDYSELYSGDVTGKTLTPGLYKWSSGVNVSGAGVTISGSETDVWIFQIAQNLELTSGAIVTLAGGAKASNIFWVVAGQVTMGTTVAMKGNILCKTKIVMSTGATLLGRALAQTAVTLDANAITIPSGLTSASPDSPSPVKFTVYQNYPNPFNPTTKIMFVIDNSGLTKLEVYNMLGKKVSTIVNEELNKGSYTFDFSGKGLASGQYVYRLTNNGNVQSKIMSFVK